MNQKTWVGLFITFLMISSIAGFAFTFTTGGAQKQRFGDFVMEFDGSQWITEINGERIGFYNTPDTITTDIPDAFIHTMQVTHQIQFTQDLNDTYAQSIAGMGYEISTNVFNTDELYVQPGVTTNESNLPVITCADGTPSVPVVYVHQGNESQASFENHCLNITIASANDVAQYRDAILYEYYD